MLAAALEAEVDAYTAAIGSRSVVREQHADTPAADAAQVSHLLRTVHNHSMPRTSYQTGATASKEHKGEM
jgi:hypothetical protein